NLSIPALRFLQVSQVFLAMDPVPRTDCPCFWYMLSRKRGILALEVFQEARTFSARFVLIPVGGSHEPGRRGSGMLPRLPASAGPAPTRSAAAEQVGRFRRGPADAVGSLPSVGRLPGPAARAAGRLATADSRTQPGQLASRFQDRQARRYPRA